MHSSRLYHDVVCQLLQPLNWRDTSGPWVVSILVVAIEEVEHSWSCFQPAECIDWHLWMESFLLWCKNLVIHMYFTVRHMNIQRGRQTDMTHFTHQCGARSASPQLIAWCGNSMSTDSAMQEWIPWSLLCFKFLLLACKFPRVFMLVMSHMYHISSYPYFLAILNKSLFKHYIIIACYIRWVVAIHFTASTAAVFICSPSRETFRELYQR